MGTIETTKHIEVALAKKVEEEINQIVDSFMSDIKTKLRDNYGGGQFLDLKERRENGNSITCLRESELKTILYACLSERHGRNMLAKKSKELISKLDLL